MTFNLGAQSLYSEWDGTQDIPSLDAGDVLSALTDDLMNFGDLQHALRNMMQRGMRDADGNRMPGLRDLLQQLRQQRGQRLDQFNMGGVMDDIRRQLEELLELERGTIDERMRQARADRPPGAQDDRPDSAEGDGADGDADGEGEGEAEDGEGEGGEAGAGAGGRPQRGSRGAGQRGQPGQSGQPGESAGAPDEEQFADMLRRIAERKQEFMEQLPEDTAGQVRALQEYEFLDPDAQHRFQDLVEQLRQAMTQSFFDDVQRMVEEMSEGDLQRMKEMVRAVNDMLVQRMRGEEPDFDAFMEQYGDMFGDNPPQSAR